MSRIALFFLVVLGGFCGLGAADLAPDGTTEIPLSAKREVVVKVGAEEVRQWAGKVPKAELPEGYELQLVAAAPLVTHPIMGCLDDRGRLFVGDAVGVNWNKAQLEAKPPNRVLMLEDVDRDGCFEKSTVFADKMTFPQGACWLNGSLYVCSPPGLWKLTDRNGDGVAEERKMIVGGFDYTGNAADVHGPFLHPNGRLYWCHGRKGHRVTDKTGQVVHEGSACGIWSCLPDGADVQWHALGCGDNPVEVDFTPSGDVIGVQNLYYNKPRGDTIMHWLLGGVYEREDQMQVIAGLPRTLEEMPVMYNFGHVAVSGCCFWKGYEPAATPGAPLQFMVTHFNTQRLVRMELTPDGATYRARENEFLKMHDGDIHLTDVMEDRDGSLLLLDTGGWFRIGCPASLMAKPDIAGAIYRVKRTAGALPNNKVELKIAKPGETRFVVKSVAEILKGLSGADAGGKLRALETAARVETEEMERDETVDTEGERLGAMLREMMKAPLEPVLEHALIHAAQHLNFMAVTLEDLKATENAAALRRMLMSFVPDDGASGNLCLMIAAKHLDAKDGALARTALGLVTAHGDADEWIGPELAKWVAEPQVSGERLKALEGFCTALIKQPEAQKIVTAMLTHGGREVRQTGLRILAKQTGGVVNQDWLLPLEKALGQAKAGELPSLLETVKKLKTAHFNGRLQAISRDEKQALTLRLKALAAVKGQALTPESFELLKGVLGDAAASSAARIQAATMLASSALQPGHLQELAPLYGTLGPVELKEVLPLIRNIKPPELMRLVATELARNPVIGSQQESLYRTLFSAAAPEVFEGIVLPALQKANEATEAKKRQLVPLAQKAAKHGNVAAGRVAFESGKGTCIACHQVGEKGRAIGPNLSTIGGIRTEQDLLESILFPSNTLARDYEAHVFEMADGQQTMAVIKSHTAEGLLVVDIAGQEKNLPQGEIVSDTTLPVSLMPMGLDQTMAEQDLLDLVAYLRSLK